MRDLKSIFVISLFYHRINCHIIKFLFQICRDFPSILNNPLMLRLEKEGIKFQLNKINSVKPTNLCLIRCISSWLVVFIFEWLTQVGIITQRGTQCLKSLLKIMCIFHCCRLRRLNHNLEKNTINFNYVFVTS